MTDITRVYRAFIKTRQVTSNANVGSNNKLSKKSEKLSTNFSSQAKSIFNDIVKLKNLLIESRTIYLSPHYLLLSTSKFMNDEQRQDFETKVVKQIKQCRDELDRLKSSIGGICFEGQRRTHFESICAYLERHLDLCTKIYSEQKCLRYKCESERKKIGRLDIQSQHLMFDVKKGIRGDKQATKDTISTVKSATTNEDSSNNIVTTNYYLEQDNDNEENQIQVSPRTELEVRQLQMENSQLYHDVAQRSEEIHAITSQVVQIAQLQSDLFHNIHMQNDLIQGVDAAAVASNDDIAAAIIHIRDAIRNTAQMRRWVIFFLVVMIFSLLFLDWYNV